MIDTLLNSITHINCKDGILLLPDKSIDCVVTSPPYWGLRDYHVDGQFGLENTPQSYVSNIVGLFSEIHRVLKDAGTVWLNLGDTYASYKDCKGVAQTLSKNTNSESAHIIEKGKSVSRNTKELRLSGLKNKDLIGIPWRVAFALQESGWYLRQDIIWNKRNPMPESVKDRCTKSHEYIFLLTKNPKYYFDYKAIMEDAAYDGRKDTKMKGSPKYGSGLTGLNPQAFRNHERWSIKDGKYIRHKRSVWTVANKPLKEAHFASFPPELIKPCILAGCPEFGIVLDPFIGSGTTALVSKQNNRNYIGFELNPDYVQIAEKRINELL